MGDFVAHKNPRNEADLSLDYVVFTSDRALDFVKSVIGSHLKNESTFPEN